MDKIELNRRLDEIDIEQYLDQAGVDYQHSYGTRGLQLNLQDCPACGEGGRKTYINAETGLGNCFHGACAFKFNKFKLVREVSGLSGAELDAHITATAEAQGWMPKKERKEITRSALEMPTKCRPIPESDGRHLRYLADRGITPDSAKYFQLTYCHDGWWSYTVGEADPKWVSYDKRVVIPIADLNGMMVSFQGRDTTGTKLPKYLFPTGFAVSGSHLYNAQNFADGTHTHAVIGEGAFDAIAVHQALQGHASCAPMLAIATFGMHLSDGPDGQIAKLLRLKERGLKTITMMWDAEAKAMVNAVKMGLLLAGYGFTVRVAQLPDGLDPNEASADQVRQAIFKARLLNRMSAIRLLHTAGAITG